MQEKGTREGAPPNSSKIRKVVVDHLPDTLTEKQPKKKCAKHAKGYFKLWQLIYLLKFEVYFYLGGFLAAKDKILSKKK